MRVAVVTVQVPFVRGGAEVLAEGLRDALISHGHRAEIVALPFKWYPPERILDHVLAARLTDLTETNSMPVDMVIGLKFPAYLVPHPRRVSWLLHQHRSAYDMWGSPLGDLAHYGNGRDVRDAIVAADNAFLPESKALYTISQNVAARLKRFNGLDATSLYHPPSGADLFTSGEARDYIFFPSRMNAAKRQHLAIEALALTREPVRLAFSGLPDNAGYEEELKAHIASAKLGERVEWLGSLSEADKRDRYAHALAVLYPPVDEDYGYVTLEAMLAARPVVTCTDSGGTLEFISDGETGLVTDPNAKALAAAMDRLWADRAEARRLGEAARARYEGMDITWRHVVETLTAVA